MPGPHDHHSECPNLRYQVNNKISGIMVKDKSSKVAQTNKIINYIHLMLPPAHPEEERDHDTEPPREKGLAPASPLLVDLMVAIQDSESKVVNKIEAEAVDVTLLRADLRKVSERVTDVEKNVQYFSGRSTSSEPLFRTFKN
ncbi:hypothetical protein NDU88_003653 [Pleurodeles waltl]|uniref:Uncharacterized protein n=1 Tax=Pleurodeles waltl TaxID=8319 RepID=A0AAV7VFZ0_PLEWA|nr:hypothetical protein NDU88_003653 [Pleurodeles waltl]